MTHHKRGRPKNRRAGCLLCKPHKANGVNAPTRQERRANESGKEYLLRLQDGAPYDPWMDEPARDEDFDPTGAVPWTDSDEEER